MVIVEAIAVSTMVSNDLVVPLLLRTRAFGASHHASAREIGGVLLAIRRVGIFVLLLLGYLYFRIAGEAYALVSIGLISFAAVAQFAPALLAGMYWKGGTRAGAHRRPARRLRLLGVDADAAVDGALGLARRRASCARGRSASRCSGPSSFLGLAGLDGLTHSLFWSLLVNVGALRRRVAVARALGARGEPGAALRRRLRARRRGRPVRARAGVLARPGAAGRPARARRAAARRASARSALLADYARRTGAPEHRLDRGRRAARAARRDAARRRHRQRLGARDGGVGGRGGDARRRGRDAHPRRGLAAARLLARARGAVAARCSRRPPSCAPPTSS